MAGIDPQDIAVDFDEAWDEEDAQAPWVKIKGEQIQLPAAMPAKLVLFVTSARSGAEDLKRSVGAEEIVKLAGMLIGADRVQGYIDGGMSFERVGEIMRRCMAVYRKRNDGGDEDGQGEAKAPETGTETTSSGSSSSSGASSSPTGAASTATAGTTATSTPS